MWLEVAAPVAGYVASCGYAYRRRYILLYKAWRRWQADAPDTNVRWWTGYEMCDTPRKNVDYWKYVWDFQGRTPAPFVGLFWPLYWVAKGTKAALHPKVKIPDYEKIKELEDL